MFERRSIEVAELPGGVYVFSWRVSISVLLYKLVMLILEMKEEGCKHFVHSNLALNVIYNSIITTNRSNSIILINA